MIEIFGLFEFDLEGNRLFSQNLSAVLIARHSCATYPGIGKDAPTLQAFAHLWSIL